MAVSPGSCSIATGAEHIGAGTSSRTIPCSACPTCPTDIGWPVEPYRNLEYFQRDHARIFFGRGRAIRELYDLLTLPAGPAESRLVFYYGQTGVGKTSVLAAGLLPRVETLFATRYCRRSAQDGLLGTLRATLAPGAEPFDLGAAWLDIEHEARRPLLIVLDQAEEAFTRPRADARPQDEVRALFEAVREAFAATRSERPSGRLILSFRKEWLAEFNEIRKASELDIKPKMLDPLDRPGVIEAIEGPADHFGLVISPDRNSVKPGETTLAEFMTDGLFDTLANPQTEQESPIAPTLQILLTRMWQEANDPKRLRGRPTFDRALFQELKGKGFKLDEVIQEQFGKIAEVEELREAVEKGLLLDLLEFFTTHEGTADTHTRQQIHDRYPHQPPERLDALLEACQNRYLLAHVGVGVDGTAAYRLTHDTLAPLLRERFRVSSALAQRARHVLEGRAATWKGQPTDPVLDRVDLAPVEEGLPWMRALEKDEPALLEASRRAEERRVAEEAERQRQLREAREREERGGQGRRDQAEAERAGGSEPAATKGQPPPTKRALWLRGLPTLSRRARQDDQLEWKSGLGEEKSRGRHKRKKRIASPGDRGISSPGGVVGCGEAGTAGPGDTAGLGSRRRGRHPRARGSLQRALDARPEVVRFLLVAEGSVTSVAFGPEGRIAAGYGAARRRRRRGGLRRPGRAAPTRAAGGQEGSVTSVAFGPEGRIAAG